MSTITVTNSFKAGIFSLLIPAVMIASQATAAGQGIQGGNIFQTEDQTAHQTSFVDPNTASAGDTLLYQVGVAVTTPGAGSLKNAMVKVQFPGDSPKSNVAIATVSADNAASVSDNATVNFSQGTELTYVPGSTKLFDKNGALLEVMPDTIMSTGVSIEAQKDMESVCAIGHSQCFVQFEMTSKTPTTPPVTPPTTPQTPVVPSTPLATAGPEDAAGAIGLMSLSAGAYALRRSKQSLTDVLRQK